METVKYLISSLSPVESIIAVFLFILFVIALGGLFNRIRAKIKH